VDDVHPDHGNTLGSTALHNTARQGDMAGVTLLLEHGANVGLENALGETPMDVAKNKEGGSYWRTMADAGLTSSPTMVLPLFGAMLVPIR